MLIASLHSVGLLHGGDVGFEGCSSPSKLNSPPVVTCVLTATCGTLLGSASSPFRWAARFGYDTESGTDYWKADICGAASLGTAKWYGRPD